MELEIIGAVVGIVSVAALAQGNGRGWPLGVVWILITGYLYLSQEIWGQAALSLYFLVVQLLGWWRWFKGAEPDLRKKARTLSRREQAAIALTWVAGTLALAPLLEKSQGNFPLLDAMGTVGSLLAQALMVFGLAESWLIYLAVDVVLVLLNAKAGMWAYLAMNLVFCGLAWRGWREWTRDGRETKRIDAAET